jgi:hypothetical protein
MRGDEQDQDGMFSYVSLEQRVPQDHPLRAVRKLTDAVLANLTANVSLFGLVDNGAYLDELALLDADVPLMLEHLSSSAEHDAGRRFIQTLAASKGIVLNQG